MHVYQQEISFSAFFHGIMIILTDNSNYSYDKSRGGRNSSWRKRCKDMSRLFLLSYDYKVQSKFVLGNESEARCQGSRRTTIWSLNGTQSCKLNLNSWCYGSYRFNWRLQNRQPASWVLTLD